ncbi:MAG: DUF4279 domain-containing protein [Candidatus Omnitrophica bacterium]|nr:DUF4279 domain-containing protein [Candidatus Omnitrophota bacterium]
MIDDPDEEAPEKPVGDLEFLCTLGGQFDSTDVSIWFRSPDLDRQEITEVLGVEPTKAWNAGESHSVGNSKRTRRLKFGFWTLETPKDSFHPESKIEELFSRCTKDLKVWAMLAEKYEAYLTVGGTILNFNRELDLTPKVLKLIAEQNLILKVDVFYWGDDEDDQL